MWKPGTQILRYYDVQLPVTQSVKVASVLSYYKMTIQLLTHPLTDELSSVTHKERKRC